MVVPDVKDARAEQIDHDLLRLRTLDLHRGDVDLLHLDIEVRVVGETPGPQVNVAVGQRQPEPVLVQAEEDRVVDDAAVGRRDEDVLALAHGALVQVPGDHHVGERESVGPADLDLALDADVPERDAVQEVPVLGDGIAVVPGMVEVVVDAVPGRAVLPRHVEVG